MRGHIHQDAALLGYLGGIAFADRPWVGTIAGLTLGLVVSGVLGVAARRRRSRVGAPTPEPAPTPAP